MVLRGGAGLGKCWITVRESNKNVKCELIMIERSKVRIMNKKWLINFP